MIYVDSSVLLAQVLVEDRRPPVAFWQERLISSRLLEYETFNRLHAFQRAPADLHVARVLLGQVFLVELAPHILARALDPFPLAVRTLDALHLASAVFASGPGQRLVPASYDDRLNRAAQALGIELWRV